MARRLIQASRGLLAVALALAIGAPAAFASPRRLDSAAFGRLVGSAQLTLDRLREEQGFPGATAAFVLDDGRMAKVATGWADVERGVAMTPDTRMLGASTGKTYVAALAAALAAEGRWSLDDKLSRYLAKKPWFGRLPNGHTVTIRQLLQHRSGIENHYDNPRYFEFVKERQRLNPGDSYPITMQDKIDFILDRPPLFPPGQGYRYTDMGYVMVGLAIEELTGESFYALVQKRFLDPVGLVLTSPSTRRRLAGLAQGYAKEPGPIVPQLRMVSEDGDLIYDPALEFTGGGFVTNSGDLARWAAALYGGRVLAAGSLAEVLAAPAPLAASSAGSGPPAQYYGLGTNVRRVSDRFGMGYGHNGYIMGYRTSMRYFSRYRFSLAFQLNTEDGQWNKDRPASGPRVDTAEIERRLSEVIADALDGACGE